MDPLGALYYRIDDGEVGGARQLGQFFERVFNREGLAVGDHADQDGRLLAVCLQGLNTPLQLILQGVNEGEEIEGKISRAPVFLQAPYLPFLVPGEEGGRKDPAWQALEVDPHGGHEVEAQQGQVRQVVLRERLAF